MKTGSETTRLIVLRGNSASGKSTIAAQIRDQYSRGIAIVGQDYLRRTLLREHDKPGAANIGLISLVARYSLAAEYGPAEMAAWYRGQDLLPGGYPFVLG